MLWTTTGDLIEEFEDSNLIKPDAFKYTFTYTLYSEDDTGDVVVIDRKTIMERPAPGKTHKITKMNVINYNQFNKPMRLVINDQTTYAPKQPLLALVIALNEDDPVRIVRMPTQFRTPISQTPANRQVDMILPVVGSMSLDFDLAKMRLPSP